ncbi:MULTISPECIES: DNA polymerase III subunit delta' [Clostridium]|uniref:DNA polymerase III subunit delta' n=1 Tax=Clostridium cibarium TaxID=2762247 RepID=A0ABR8PX07_9CLOT|nr:DNA polymerase III subunit delta' [Clostridium sp. HBUAS56017]MBD7912669.1 DNA polymerase III subunit delta' [Clostridium cibarium]
MKEFIGFENIINGFMKRVDNNTLSHAHLIVGPDGIGKSLIAKKFALKILGKNDDYNYVDIINYKSDKASFGVDEVRKIIEEVSKKPYEGDKKVIIVHQGNKLTVQAQNAMLKTIEEPPKGVYIVLLSESLELLLDTIKSRCQIYKLTPLDKDYMIRYIKSIGENDEDKVLTAIAYGEGIPGRAEKILKDNELEKLRNLIIELFNEINKNNDNAVLEYETKFNKFKNEKYELLNLIASFIRDIIVYKELRDKNNIINVDKIDDVGRLSSALSYNRLNSMLRNIEKARNNFENNISYSMAISIMLIGFLEG